MFISLGCAFHGFAVKRGGGVEQGVEMDTPSPQIEAKIFSCHSSRLLPRGCDPIPADASQGSGSLSDLRIGIETGGASRMA
jgi:hypothetical protein